MLEPRLLNKIITHPTNPSYRIAFVDVIAPHWAHIKADRRPASIVCSVTGYGSIDIETAEKLRDALTEAITLAKSLKLEKPRREESR